MMLIANSIESTKGEMSGFGGGTQLWKLLTAVFRGTVMAAISSIARREMKLSKRPMPA
jgi:hypothetical protein